MVRVADRRAASQGKTRSCPHCRATILESAAVCPACRHHLRFENRRGEQEVPASKVALRVAGEFARGREDPPAEYSVVVVIRDPRGTELARKVVGVGGLGPGDERSLELTVEIFDAPGGS
jgi:RNA polymerase subunit RPABC4/transcription elongation factor Spt4